MHNSHHHNHMMFFPVHHSVTQSQIEEYEERILRGQDWRVRELGRTDWERYWEMCFQTNLLQAWEYGDAKKNAENSPRKREPNIRDRENVPRLFK